MQNTWRSKYFYGKQISEYGIEQKRLDYRTLAQAFDAVLNNSIMEVTYDIGHWEQEHGYIDNLDEIDELNNSIWDIRWEMKELYDNDLENSNEYEKLQEQLEELQEQLEELEHEQEYQHEIFQYYIVSDNGAKIIKEFTNDPLFYNEALDMYVWGVTHYGTSWDYVLTDTVLELDNEC